MFRKIWQRTSALSKATKSFVAISLSTIAIPMVISLDTVTIKFDHPNHGIPSHCEGTIVIKIEMNL
jgi:hypothetical protein